MASRKTIYVDSDVLVIGGGFGGCGAAYESRYWGVQSQTENESLKHVLGQTF